jgi:TonB family protein
LARQARIQGTVMLQIVISKTGDVRDMRLLSGHPMLAPAAIEAVKQWKYQPYMQDGEAIEFATNVRVNFRLPDGGPLGIVASVPTGAAEGTSGSMPSVDDVLRISEAEIRQLRTEKVDPAYPPAAAQAHIQGTVVLDVQVNASGDVENVRLYSGHPMLAKAAIEAVKQWKYRPYVKDGNDIPFAGIVRLNFTMGSGDTGGIVSELPITDPAPAPRPGVPRRVRVSSGVSQGLLAKKVNPVYPPDARKQHIQGVVILHVNIDREGNVVNIEPISGDPSLAVAATDAVRQWKYKPYMLNGEPVEIDTQVQVNFTLMQ